MTLFGQPHYTTQFCPKGHPILILTGKCKHECVEKKPVIKRGDYSGKSKTPFGGYEYK